MAPAAEPGASDAGSPPLALIEVIDRDGLPRQAFAVRRWPATVGRALDNDLVLGDPHVADRHLVLDAGAGGLEIGLGATRNGLAIGRRRLAGGSRTVIAADGTGPIEATLGRTLLRIRLATQPLAAELPLAAPPRSGGIGLLVLAAVVLGELLAVTWLESDPDGFARAAAVALLSGLGGAGLWCGAWALLSKTFAREARFGWHLRVFLVASVAMLVVSSVPNLLAFAFSWPWASGYDFAPKIAVAAGALYFHLRAVEPSRPRTLRAAAVMFGVVGVAVSVWFNLQRLDRFGDELYMSHLFPPALRLARPAPGDRLVDRLSTIKAPLDRKAREAGEAEDGGDTNDEP